MSDLARHIADARPRVLAALAVQLRDLDLAEEAFAEASERLLTLDERPDKIAGWLMVAAKRKALDTNRRRAAETRAIDGAALTSDMADILHLPEPIADERLRLIFICCHPAIALEARTALALKVICGLPVAEIARVFLVSEPTMLQRITRAKRKVAEAGIPFELPARKQWGDRLGAVLLTLELAYTIAYQDAAGERTQVDGGRLSEEVARLAAIVAELLPQEPEALGLAALVWLARSREAARVDDTGAMVPLSQQETKLWDSAAIEQARQWLDAAALFEATGPYQVMAAIQLTHARRVFGGETDWISVVRLYDALLLMRPGPVVEVNRALALAKVKGAEAGLTALQALNAARLGSARPWYAARAELLTSMGRLDEAKEALERAMSLDPPRAERLLLERKLAALACG